MKRNKKESYFKGFTKSPKQLLNGLIKELKETKHNVTGYLDTCEYHLELEHPKNYDGYVDVQCICEDVSSKLDDIIDLLETDGIESDLDDLEDNTDSNILNIIINKKIDIIWFNQKIRGLINEEPMTYQEYHLANQYNEHNLTEDEFNELKEFCEERFGGINHD